MRLIMTVVVFLLLVTGVASSAAMTGTAGTVGGGSDTVPHCQVLDYDVAASDTISSVNAQVVCDESGSFTVTASVNSGAGTGQQGVALTADIAAGVSIAISPSVGISGSACTVSLQVQR